MKRFVPVILFMIFAIEANADYSGGILFDSSSNMLMNPGGESGMYSLVYGEYSYAPSQKLLTSYSFAGGFIERNNGLQYQSHEATLWFDILTKQKIAWSISADAGFSRFGDVTIIDGYNRGSLQTNIKSYLTPTLLLRWEGLTGVRSYRSFETENYSEAETSLRIDKFLESRTTLRLQMDAGLRRYGDVEGRPQSARYGTSSRIAQSFGDLIGLSLDAKVSALSSTSAEDSGTNVFNRIFLDDRYKYSDKGVSAQLKYLIPGKGSLTFKSNYDVRTYGKGSIESYDYLPQNGWTETEQGVSLTVAYSFAFIPDFVSPSMELYYVDVEASESYLSYAASGLSLRLTF